MKNKNGFVSMTLVYTFLIVFLFLMLAILNSYANKNKFIDAINDQIDRDIGENRVIVSTLFNKLLVDNTVEEDKNIEYFNIANYSVGNGNGLYYTDDKSKTDENGDGSTKRIYFFRGEVNNNYVVMNGICFRIIRTNEDGNIRMIYGGVASNNKCLTKNDSDYNPTLGISSYNDLSDDEKYVRYMYEPSNEEDLNPQSNIKTILDNWYVSNVLEYREYTSDLIFCNDKLVSLQDGDIKYFNARSFSPMINEENIIVDNTFNCYYKSDRFNLSLLSGGLDDSGNNKLNYPVGLVTVADLIYAGGYISAPGDTYQGGEDGIINNEYYMNIGKDYWTISPFYYNSGEPTENIKSGANMIAVNTDGSLIAATTNEIHNVVPVIAVKGNVRVKAGLGTANNPYVLNYTE